jgi:hypothetical protein
MENQLLQLTEIEFDTKFELIDNHLDNNASFDGKMFETYGEEIDFVLEMSKQNRVITILEGDCEQDEFGEESPCMYYASGYHLVNRIGYLITKEPITFDFEVKID